MAEPKPAVQAVAAVARGAARALLRSPQDDPSGRAPKDGAPPSGRKAGAPPSGREPGVAQHSLLAGMPSPWAVRRLIVILVLSSGLLFGLCIPGHQVGFAWLAAYVPLFLALDLTLRRSAGGWGTLLKVLACCWPVGAMMAAVSGGWVVNTSYVFGGLSLPIAWAVNVLGYGTLMGLEVFGFLGLPYLLCRGRFLFGLLLIPLWATVGEIYVPRFLYWTFGQVMYPVPALVQLADVLGSGGLNFWLLPLHLTLAAWIQQAYAPGDLPRRTLQLTSAALAVAFGLSFAYGAWRLDALAQDRPGAPRVRLVGIQPNFSLKALASNPDLSPSDREASLQTLISDSNAALLRSGLASSVPTAVIWPESVYPVPYFEAPQARAQVESWARTLGVHLLLTTVDFRTMRQPDGRLTREVFGAAVHVPPGGWPAVYHKINLIPFGESIPFADLVPAWGRFLQYLVPRISEFKAGRDPTVFPIAQGVTIAPLICFDAMDYHAALGMAARGANVGVLMANLAWFGRTTATTQMERFTRFRAIETRIPILMLSQNGESVLIDARGEPASARVGLFEVGSLSLEVSVGAPSFYARYHAWVHGLYLLGLVLAAGLGLGAPWLRRRGGWRRALRPGTAG